MADPVIWVGEQGNKGHRRFRSRGQGGHRLEALALRFGPQRRHERHQRFGTLLPGGQVQNHQLGNSPLRLIRPALQHMGVLQELPKIARLVEV